MQVREHAAAGMGIHRERLRRVTADWSPGVGWLPDLDDGPTRGALLDVAREVWGDPLLHVQWSWTWSAWYVYGAHHRLPGLIGGCPTEGAAIAQAILAAPAVAVTTTPPPMRSRDSYAQCKHCGHIILSIDGACPGCRRHPFLP